jgi:hypothetical protein
MTGTPLPRSLVPLPDESLPGFLLRLAHRLDLSPARLAEATGLPTSGTTARIPASLLLTLDSHTAVRFAAATRLKPAEAQALTLATVRGSYPPVDPAFGFHHRRSGATGRTVSGVFVQERWILARSSRYCPQCLAGDASTIQRRHGGAWNKLWRLPVVFACPTHRRFLKHTCPACAQPAMSRGPNSGLLGRPSNSTLHPTACRNPRVSGDHHACGYRLDTAATNPDSDLNIDPQLALQARLLHLLRRSEPTISVGNAATPSQYFIDLRVLACLATASWPAASPLVADRRPAELIDDHATATRRRIEQVRRTANKARDHALYDTPPADIASCAALLTLADTITQAGDPDTVRDLLTDLVDGLPDTHYDWIKQFLRGDGHCSPGLQTALGPAVGAAHVVARTGIASMTTKRRYPPPRPVRFGLQHIPQRTPSTWTNTSVTPFADLPARSLHHVIAGRLARMVLGGTATNANVAHAVVPLGMSRWATTYSLAHIADRLAATGRQAAFDQAIHALADYLDAHPALTDYGSRRNALDNWSIPSADWTQLTNGLPTVIQTSAWHWRRVEWDDRKRILASVWVWYHATSGDRAYNIHTRRDWTNLGRLSPTAKYVSSRWKPLVNGTNHYGPLRERIDPYLDDIIARIKADEPLDD